MSYKVKLTIPSQPNHDYKAINRDIRNAFLFRDYVVEKSKDRHTLVFDFQNKEKYDVLMKILKNTIKALDYEIKIEENV